MVARTIIWLVVITAIAAPVTWYLTREVPIEVTAVQVARGPVEQTIAAVISGTVMPGVQSMVAASTIGTVSVRHVEEGDHVEAGDLLLELAHDELDAQLALTEVNRKVGESRLLQVRLAAEIYREISATQLSQASAQLEQAKLDFERIRALSERNAVSQSDLDRMKLALRVAQEARDAAAAGQRENEVRIEEVRSAESGIEQLSAAIAVAKAARERAFIRAPFAGVVAKILPQVGEAVAMGLPLVQLVKDEVSHVVAPFDEANLADLKLGQRARIELDAYPGKEFPGEVYYIAPVVSVNKDLSRTLEVKVRILEDEGKFVPGMSADVTLIADRKDDVLFVPTESMIRDEYAYVIEHGRAVRRDVKVGIGNWESREILDGLAEGEQIITSVNVKGLDNGHAVRVVEALDSR